MKSPLPPALRLIALLGLTTLLVAGCLAPASLHRTVSAYDRTVAAVEAELLLLNIARACHDRPLHFTTVSSVAATFSFSTTAGIVGSIARGPSAISTIGPALAATVTENPTITIVPVQGEEYTRRILTPIDVAKFQFLIHQGIDLNMLLRLLGGGLLVEGPGPAQFLENDPGAPAGYREFRRRVLHLAGLQAERALYIGPVIYEEMLRLPRGRVPTPSEALSAAEKGYRLVPGTLPDEYVLTRRVHGRTVVTNYDPMKLTNDERIRLDESARQHPKHHIVVDVRPGLPGGDYPMTGRLILRSFNRVIFFLAEGVEKKVEYRVERDARTRTAVRDPQRTLAISTQGRRTGTAVGVSFLGRYYTIGRSRETGPAGALRSWDLDAFRVLYHIFQMTLADVGRVPTPNITIAK